MEVSQLLDETAIGHEHDYMALFIGSTFFFFFVRSPPFLLDALVSVHIRLIPAWMEIKAILLKI